jgi:hypothetical protein
MSETRVRVTADGVANWLASDGVMTWSVSQQAVGMPPAPGTPPAAGMDTATAPVLPTA